MTANVYALAFGLQSRGAQQKIGLPQDPQTPGQLLSLRSKLLLRMMLQTLQVWWNFSWNYLMGDCKDNKYRNKNAGFWKYWNFPLRHKNEMWEKKKQFNCCFLMLKMHYLHRAFSVVHFNTKLQQHGARDVSTNHEFVFYDSFQSGIKPAATSPNIYKDCIFRREGHSHL